MLPRVRTLLLASPPLLLIACHGPATRDTLPGGFAPETRVVERLAPGTTLRAETTGGVADEPLWRAAAAWWREALRQSVAFELRDGADAAVVLRLSIEPATRALTAHLVRGEAITVLATTAIANGDVPAAVDRLAWSARAALGETSEAPVPVAACLSDDPAVVIAIDDASLLLRDGSPTAAEKALLAARRRDGAAPAVLDGLAAVQLLRGDAQGAERTCREALGYEARLSPTMQQRLSRTLLLARASLHPEHAGEQDRKLLLLAETGRRERPFDPQIALSEAIANNFLGEFARSRPVLDHLRAAAPDDPIVAYHLGWACLGTGDGNGAVEAFDAAATRLPVAWVAVQRAIACFTAGDEARLGKLLTSLRAEVRGEQDPAVHEVRRMQAAHALLTGDRDTARRTIREDLRWVLDHPEALERRAGEFAQQAAVLVRLGGATDLVPLLADLQGRHASTAVADACSFVAGLAEIARSRERLPQLERTLARGGESAWSLLLAAFAHEVRGEIRDMQDALAHAARLDDSPMTKALLAKGMRAAGKVQEADALQAALRREMLTIHLRRAPQHPVLGPELAFAYVGA